MGRVVLIRTCRIIPKNHHQVSLWSKRRTRKSEATEQEQPSKKRRRISPWNVYTSEHGDGEINLRQAAVADGSTPSSRWAAIKAAGGTEYKGYVDKAERANEAVDEGNLHPCGPYNRRLSTRHRHACVEGIKRGSSRPAGGGARPSVGRCSDESTSHATASRWWTLPSCLAGAYGHG